MMQQIKAKMFPCTEVLNRVMDDNRQAADRLIAACSISPDKSHFPPLKAGQIVNPR
jgi:hypothetical protein